MATFSKKSLYLGPSPWADEPSVEVLLVLTPEELAKAPASASILVRIMAHFFVPTAMPEAEPLSIGRFIVELARTLLNERGGVVAAASARMVPEGVLLTLGFHHPQASLMALEGAVRLTLGADQSQPEQIGKAIEALWLKTVPLSPDPQASILLAHSRKKGIPSRSVDVNARLWLHGWGARSEMIFEASPRGDSGLGLRLASVKPLTKRIAVSTGFRVLPAVVVDQASELEQAARAVGFPCVTKPVIGSMSKGVTVGIVNPSGLRAGFELAKATSGAHVLVERYAQGEAYRLMVLRGKLWKAILRPRPTVVGDGLSTILELVKLRNRSLEQGRRPSLSKRPMPLDAELEPCLRRQGFTSTSVPGVGVKVVVREIPLLSKGATGYEDVTSRIHQDVRLAAEGLAGLMGAVSLGIDIMAEDIRRPETVYFLEANLTPGLSMFKEVGMTPAEIGSAVLGDLPARIPSLLVLAARADHARILELAPRSESVGWTDGRQVGLGRRSFPTAVQSPHDGVDLLVRNPAVESLLILCDPADLVSAGLPLDRVDVTRLVEGVVLSAEWDTLVRRSSAKLATNRVEQLFIDD